MTFFRMATATCFLLILTVAQCAKHQHWESVSPGDSLMLLQTGTAARPARGLSARPRPSIVFVLADDLGYGSIGYNNPEKSTPVMDALSASGVRLDALYAHSICSPTRASLLTGRHSYKVLDRNYLEDQAWGIDVGYTMLPAALKAVGYRTHMVGKWHQGFYKADHLPTRRGFETFFGFLSGSADHFNQKIDEPICPWGRPVSLLDGESPAKAFNGTVYSDVAFTDRAVELIGSHNFSSGPLFLFVALSNPHAPFEAPPWAQATTRQMAYDAMVRAVDDSVGRISTALTRANAMDNTLFIFSSDNGASMGSSGSNSPFRGAKYSNWEGGIRVPAFIAGGVLPEGARGRTLKGMISMADWYATLAGIAGAKVDYGGPAPSDSINQWPYITGVYPWSLRSEIVHEHRLSSNNSRVGALRVGNWKLLVGTQYAARLYGDSLVDADPRKPAEFSACGNSPCLFDVEADPTESTDLALAHPQVLQELLHRFEEIGKDYHVPLLTENWEYQGACDAWEKAGGFVVPGSDVSQDCMLG
eukprot:CAMPEP_0170613910 /NCGR_PEP_ID=MMETSP0224-20130122/24521_1 /TAXON_ID=285029 /ORGANISM="Togula jolla, Strain CCCM 725" /LENGTH=530 /DNA_ID=CAMNT_0010939537 /DNA_START=24 /DNA_END=1613 /DNA_ORIENTATION=-